MRILKKLDFKIILIFITAFILRILWLQDNLFFGFEQGRDLLAVRQITLGKFTLIGAWTSIPGFFHGALSYWLLIPPFILSNGDPYLITVFLIVINVAGIALFYKAATSLFGERVALLSAILLTISYTAIIYARWLSNPNLVLAAGNGLFYSLVKIRENGLFLVLATIFWAVIFHLQAIVAVGILPAVLIVVLIYRNRISLRSLIFSITVLLLFFSSYIAFDIRHDFIMSKSLFSYFTAKKIVQSDVYVNNPKNMFLEQFSNEITDNLFPGQKTLAVAILCILLIVSVYSLRKEIKGLIILVFLFTTPLLFYLVGIVPLRHYLMTSVLILPIFVAFSVEELSKIKLKPLGLAIFLIVIFGNFWAIFTRLPQSTNLPENKGIFLYPQQHTYLTDQKKLIDYVYSDSAGRPFSYDYYSIPYWKKEAWEYLFTWYGQKKYKSLPSPNRTETFYVLIEPDEIQSSNQDKWYKNLNESSELIYTFTSGKLVAEKREQI